MITLYPKHMGLKGYFDHLLIDRVVIPKSEWPSTYVFDTGKIQTDTATFFDHGIQYQIIIKKKKMDQDKEKGLVNAKNSKTSKDRVQLHFERIVVLISVPGWKSHSLEQIGIPIMKKIFEKDILFLNTNHVDEVFGSLENSSTLDSIGDQENFRERIHRSKYDFFLCFMTRRETGGTKKDVNNEDEGWKHKCKHIELSDELSNIRRVLLSPSISDGFSNLLDPNYMLPDFFTSVNVAGSQVFAYEIPINDNYKHGQDSKTDCVCFVFSHKFRLTVTFAVYILDEVDRAIATLILQQMVTTAGSSTLTPYLEYRRANDPPKEFKLFNQRSLASSSQNNTKAKSNGGICNGAANHQQVPSSIHENPNKAGAGFVSFSFELRHIKQDDRRKCAIDSILMFMPYLRHHIRCSKSHMSQRMRKYTAAFEVMKMPPIEHKQFSNRE